VTIALFSTWLRWALAAGGVALLVATIVAVRRGYGRVGALLGVGTLGALGALAGEAVVAVTVRVSAPGATDFNQYRWVFLSPWGRLGLWLGGTAVIAITALAWRSTRNAAAWRRALLIALRGGAAFAALVVFLEPAVELRQVAREPNRIAILIDDSKSMSLAERAEGPTRIERARRLLAASHGALDAWQRDHKLDFYTFADNVAATTPEALTNDPAQGRSTLLRKALEYVRGRYEGRDLAGVVVISDGAATGSFDEDSGDGAVRDFLRSLDTRVHTVWAARDGLKDVAIARVMADEFAFVRTAVKIEARIHTTGLPARQVMVTLSTDGQPLRQKLVELPAGEHDVPVTFEITPPRVGRYVYEVAVPVAPGEAVASNNTRSFVVRVIRDKIRVLQVAGQPSWDERALRQMLKSNPNVDLISFFILRTQDDISLVPNDEMSLIRFPTRELFEQQLPSFDLIILQNFEYMPYDIRDYLENIRSYVEGGGGFAMLGGPLAFGSGGYQNTPVAAALPVELAGPLDSGVLVDTQRFSPQLTDIGAQHPVTALRYAVDDNRAAWAQLPQLEGVNVIEGAKPDALVLAVHPRLRTKNGRPMPVIVAGEYGKGRTLAVTTDTLWRWGFVAAARPGDDGRQYTKLWENAIRWLIQDPDLRNLHVDSDAVEYVPGATVRVTTRLLGRDYQPLAGGEVSLELKRGANPQAAELVQTQKVKVGDDGTAMTELTGLTPGVYRVIGHAKIAGHDVDATDIFLVRENGIELDRPTGDRAALDAISRATGGIALGTVDQLPAELPFDPPRIVRVDRRTDVELWSRPILLVLLVGLLGLEWLLRQRSGYL